MRTIVKLLCFVLFTMILAAQCRTKTSSGKTTTDSSAIPVSKNPPTTKFDAVTEQLRSKNELATKDLIALKIIDTTLTAQLGGTSYCDTTVQLNDSVYYSIIHTGDQTGVCSYIFLAGMDKKSKTVIGSKFLYPDCNVDYSSDTYELYDYSLLSKDKIQLTKTTVFQKKTRTSPDEEENIDHKQEKKSFITISQSGQISNSNN